MDRKEYLLRQVLKLFKQQKESRYVLNIEEMTVIYDGTEYAAGADLYAVIHNDTKTVEILPEETVFLDTGVTMEIPEGYVGLVYARSGLSCKQGLAPANKVGVIDADYRSSIKVALYNQSKEVRTVSDGDRIAQIIIQPVTQFKFKEVDKLSETNRGKGGFGSTGKA